ASAIDRLVELSPEREIGLTAGWMKHGVQANWKMGIEGVVDNYHPKFVHKSIGKAFGQQGFKGDAGVVRDLGDGHTELDWAPLYQKAHARFAWFGGGGGDESMFGDYKAAMIESWGPEIA